MAHLLTVDLDTLTPAESEILAGFIMTFADGKKSGFVDQPAPPAIDPAAAFGKPIPTGKISDAGPSLVLPSSIGIADLAPRESPNAPAPPVPAGASVTLDKDGLPWDVRIHASSKAQNADGTWRLKRGLAKDHLDKVTAELRQVMAIPSPASVPAPAAGPKLVPPPPPPAQTAAAPPPPPTDEVAIRDQYIALFGRVSAAMSSGKLSQSQLDTCLLSIGIPSLPLLAPRLDLVPQACALIDGVIAGASA